MLKLDTCMLAADIQINIMSTFSFIKDLYSYFKFYRQQLEQWFVTMIAEALIKILSSVSFIRYLVILNSTYSINKCVPIELS